MCIRDRPAIAMFGVLISFTGIGNTTAVISLILYSLLPIVRSTYVSIKSVDKRVLEASLAMGSTEMQMLCKIKLPLAFPLIFSIHRYSLASSFKRRQKDRWN